MKKVTKLEQLSDALHDALKKDISIDYYNDNSFAYTINVCKLDSVYSEQVSYDYETGRISRSCGYYWTKEMERLSFKVVKIIGAIITTSKDKQKSYQKIKEIFDFYSKQFLSVFQAKYSIKLNTELNKILYN